MTKRISLFIGGAVFALVVGLLAAWLYIGRTGTSELENWIGRQIVGILENYVTPQVHFDNLDYQAPRTVILDNLALTAAGRPIVQIAWAKLELAEIPQRGKPILIEQIELRTPRFQFITTPKGGLLGWSDFVKEKAVEEPETVPPGQRLSDVLVLRHVAIHEGEVIYENQDDGPERMTLPGINLQLDTPKVEGEPGWHQLAGRLKRDPLLDLQLDGRINLDTGLLDIASLQLAASLSERQYATLPPALQSFLRAHEVRGALKIAAQGRLPLDKPAEFVGTVSADLEDARVRYRGNVMPVDSVRVSADLPKGGIDVAVTGVNLAREDESFFSVKAITARLAGIPAEGEPLVIERIHAAQPHVVFASQRAGELQGWSQLADAAQKPAGLQRETDRSDASELLRALRLHEFQIEDGAVSYRPNRGMPITLDGINIALRATERETDSDVLDVAGTIEAGPLLNAELRGDLDTAKAMLNLNQFQAATDIQPAMYDQLPPRARDWVTQHRFEGRFSATGEGQIPLNEPAEGRFQAEATLDSGRLQYNGVTIPVGRARVQVRLPERRIEATVGGLELISEDQPFFRVGHAEAALTLPADGRRVLEELSIDKPYVRLVASPAGNFVGWNRLTTEPTSSSPARQQSKARRDSEPLVVRNIAVRGASIAYASSPVFKPMQIDGIDLTFKGDGDDLNLLHVAADVADDLVQARLAGELNTAARVLTVQDFQAGATISKDQYAALPETMQPMLVPYQFAGSLAVTGSGIVPLDNPEETKGELKADLTSGSLTYKGLHVPLGKVEVKAKLPDGPFAVTLSDLAVAAGKMTLAEVRTISLQSPAVPWGPGPKKIQQIKIEQPVFNLVRQPQGELIGWSQLADAGPPATAPTPAAQAGGTDTTGVGPSGEFSIDQVEIDGAVVRYEGPETEGPVVLEGIDAILRTEKAKASQTAFSGEIRRPELLAVEFQGRYAANPSALIFSHLTAKLGLEQDGLAKLPEATRKSLQRQQFTGRIEASWKGTIPLGSTGEADGHFVLDARDTRLAYANLIWPVGDLHVEADLPKGPVTARAEQLAIHAGKLQIFSTAALDLQITELATGDQAMRIDHLAMKSPKVVLVSREDGYAGWSQLTADDETEEANGDPAPPPLLKQLRIEEGELVYAPAPGQEVMVLPGIHLNANLQGPDRNVYELTGRIQRAPALEMNLQGRFNAEARALDLKTLRLKADLSDQQVQALPPSMQALVRDHKLRGRFSVEAQGRVAFADPEKLEGRLTATGQNLHFAYEQTNWPIQQLDLTAAAQRGVVSAEAKAELLGGRLQADAQVSLPQGEAFDLNWRVSQIHLEQMMRAVQSEDSEYAGILNSGGKVSGRLGELPQTLSGSGEVTVDRGKLLSLPIIQGVVRLLRVPLGLGGRGPEDRARAEWAFGPRSLNIKRMALVSPLVALESRGGQIYYDGRLDLNLSAQPLHNLPKALPDVLPEEIGKFGNLLQDIGNLTGKIVTYHVGGTIDNPQVTPVPLGLSGK